FGVDRHAGLFGVSRPAQTPALPANGGAEAEGRKAAGGPAERRPHPFAASHTHLHRPATTTPRDRHRGRDGPLDIRRAHRPRQSPLTMHETYRVTTGPERDRATSRGGPWSAC